MTGNAPILKFQDGLIEIAVFANTTDNGATVYNYQISRSYQDGSTWKQTTSLSGTEPLVAAALYQRAYAAVAKIRQDAREERSAA